MSVTASRRRGQANLPVLAVALVILTTVTSVSVALADGALAGADRTPEDRRVASAVADRLVAADSDLTTRANVVNETAIDGLDASSLDDRVAPARDTAVRVRLGEQTLVERGEPDDGVTVRRLVLVGNQTVRTRTIELPSSTTVTLPRRTPAVTLDIDSAANTTVRTVRANGRVVLDDSDGLGEPSDGSLTVDTSRYETTNLEFETTGNPHGTVTVEFYPTQTTKAILEVTVDA